MLVRVLDVLIAGLVMGGIYALAAMGLNLQYGVVRVLNMAHGDFIMLGGFGTFWLSTLLRISPLLSLSSAHRSCLRWDCWFIGSSTTPYD